MEHRNQSKEKKRWSADDDFSLARSIISRPRAHDAADESLRGSG
jgi:hypothetical protein